MEKVLSKQTSNYYPLATQSRAVSGSSIQSQVEENVEEEELNTSKIKAKLFDETKHKEIRVNNSFFVLFLFKLW